MLGREMLFYMGRSLKGLLVKCDSSRDVCCRGERMAKGGHEAGVQDLSQADTREMKKRDSSRRRKFGREKGNQREGSRPHRALTQRLDLGARGEVSGAGPRVE